MINYSPYFLYKITPNLITLSENTIDNIMLPANKKLTSITSTVGLVGSKQYLIETFLFPPGILLRVEGGSDFYISPDGEAILRIYRFQENARRDKKQPLATMSNLDQDIILGPAIVLALAMRGTWSLHASAAMFQNQTMAFLGESGQGKSTLAAYLDSKDWQRVADDILPITFKNSAALALPRFPQLKLSPEKQPGFNFPEQLPINNICVLTSVEERSGPKLDPLPPSLAVQVLLKHTAGTRLLGPDLLGKHLSFCGQISKNIPVYRLLYPHRQETLPEVKELLEKIC